MSGSKIFPADDLRPAQWLVDSLTEFGGRIDQLLPTGYPAYVRLFHRPDQGLPDAESAPTWREVAERHGTVFHEEAQWRSLTGGRPDSPHRPDLDSASDQPLEGSLDRLSLPRLACHLQRHTSTPDQCHFALWEGFGSSPRSWEGRPTFSTPGRGYWLFPPAPVQEVVAHAVEFEVAGMEEQSISPTYVRRMRELGLVQSPSLWWPGDRAWVVYSEIDYDSTLIAGSTALLEDLLEDRELECLRVQPDSSLLWNADRVNVK